MDKSAPSIKTQTFTSSAKSRTTNLIVKRSFPDNLQDENNKTTRTESSACGHETKSVKRHHNSVPFYQLSLNTRPSSNYGTSFSDQQSSAINRVKNNNNGFPFYRYGNYTLDFPNFQYPPPYYIPQMAPDKFLLRSHLIQMNETPQNLISGSKWDFLSSKIWDMFIASQQTENLYRKKIELWKYLYFTIKSKFPKYSLYLVGSTINGYGTNQSDMDLCLLVNLPMNSRFQAIYHLRNIQNMINCTNMFSGLELIKAKVPIVKFKDRRNNIEIDMNCNNAVGIHNTHLLYCYSQLDWRVKPLVVIIKLWAKHNNINDPKNKSISSYSFVLMIIHFLQCGVSPPVLPCLQKDMPDKFNTSMDIHKVDICEQMPKYESKNTYTLGELLCRFFEYFADFEYDKFAISVRSAQKIKIENCKTTDSHEWKFLCIEEPFDLSNTARSVYDADVFSHILEVFKKTSVTLQKNHLLNEIMPIF